MAKYIPLDALVAEIWKRLYEYSSLKLYDACTEARASELGKLLVILNTLEVKEVKLCKEEERIWKDFNMGERHLSKNDLEKIAKHFFELGLKAQHDNWKMVDNTNLPQSDKNKIYCVFTKDRYILATVINHPQDEDLLQWKCTEFPHHRYDMCEGDKYMQIV